MAKANKIITVTLTHSKTTKNTYRFDAPDSDTPPALREVYMQQSAFPGGPPKSITVTVEV